MPRNFRHSVYRDEVTAGPWRQLVGEEKARAAFWASQLAAVPQEQLARKALAERAMSAEEIAQARIDQYQSFGQQATLSQFRNIINGALSPRDL